MNEPINIMGVVAFPNEDGKRDCRFIDPHYNELFTVPDGGNVVLTYIDRTKKVLPCTYNLVPVLNVYENTVLPVELDGRKTDRLFVESILETLGLSERIASLPSQLSGGQQQRVAIARALAATPAIILADEPTGNLDSKTSQNVLSLLKITSQKYVQTIVMITHNEEIAQMADRIVRIEDGQIVSRV